MTIFDFILMSQEQSIVSASSCSWTFSRKLSEEYLFASFRSSVYLWHGNLPKFQMKDCCIRCLWHHVGCSWSRDRIGCYYLQTRPNQQVIYPGSHCLIAVLMSSTTLYTILRRIYRTYVHLFYNHMAFRNSVTELATLRHYLTIDCSTIRCEFSR